MRRAGIGDLYLMKVDNARNDGVDPVTLGFDAAVEFQPYWSALGSRLGRAREETGDTLGPDAKRT